MIHHVTKFFVIALFLALAAPAYAALDAVEEGYELSTDELTLPAHAAGQVVISGCEECESTVHAVNAQTRYFIGSSQVSLSDLRDAVNAQIGTFIYVAYSLDTNAVTSITLSPSS